MHEEGPGGLGVGGLGEVFLGGVVKEGGVVAARELGEELAPGKGVLLRKVRHLEKGGLGVEEEEAVPEAVQVVPYGVLGKAPLPPPVQNVLRATGAREGPVEHRQEEAVEDGLLQGEGVSMRANSWARKRASPIPTSTTRPPFRTGIQGSSMRLNFSKLPTSLCL